MPTPRQAVAIAPLLVALTKALEESTTRQVTDVGAELVEDEAGRRVELRATVIIGGRRRPANFEDAVIPGTSEEE